MQILNNAEELNYAFYDADSILLNRAYCGYYEFCRQDWCEDDECSHQSCSDYFVTVWIGNERVACIKNREIAIRDNGSYTLVYDEVKEYTYVFFGNKQYFTAALGHVSELNLIYLNRLQLFVKRQRVVGQRAHQYTTVNKLGQVSDCFILPYNSVKN